MENNKIREFDLWINSKAPMNEFGNMPRSTVTAVLGDNTVSHTINEHIGKDAAIYHGDGVNAKFVPDETASSRLFMYMRVNIDEGIVKDKAVGSYGTENLKTHEHSMADPASFAKMEKGSSAYASSVLGFGYTGGNPDKSLQVDGKEITPKIDIQGQLRFSDDKNGDLLVQGEVYGDGFPATSMFVDFGNNNKLMLGSSPISEGGTVWDLEGGADKRIMNINLSVEFKEDTPVGVKDWNTMKTYSVEDWNTLHESTPMIESEHSKEQIIDKGEPISSLEIEKEFFASNPTVEIDVYNAEQNQPFDSTTKAQEIVANMDLPQRDEGMDYGMDDGMDYC